MLALGKQLSKFCSAKPASPIVRPGLSFEDRDQAIESKIHIKLPSQWQPTEFSLSDKVPSKHSRAHRGKDRNALATFVRSESLGVGNFLTILEPVYDKSRKISFVNHVLQEGLQLRPHNFPAIKNWYNGQRNHDYYIPQDGVIPQNKTSKSGGSLPSYLLVVPRGEKAPFKVAKVHNLNRYRIVATQISGTHHPSDSQGAGAARSDPVATLTQEQVDKRGATELRDMDIQRKTYVNITAWIPVLFNAAGGTTWSPLRTYMRNFRGGDGAYVPILEQRCNAETSSMTFVNPMVNEGEAIDLSSMSCNKSSYGAVRRLQHYYSATKFTFYVARGHLKKSRSGLLPDSVIAVPANIEASFHIAEVYSQDKYLFANRPLLSSISGGDPTPPVSIDQQTTKPANVLVPPTLGDTSPARLTSTSSTSPSGALAAQGGASAPQKPSKRERLASQLGFRRRHNDTQKTQLSDQSPFL